VISIVEARQAASLQQRIVQSWESSQPPVEDQYIRGIIEGPYIHDRQAVSLL
jgi:hypothetical protein